MNMNYNMEPMKMMICSVNATTAEKDYLSMIMTQLDFVMENIYVDSVQKVYVYNVSAAESGYGKNKSTTIQRKMHITAMNVIMKIKGCVYL